MKSTLVALLAAASPTTLDKIRQVPSQAWINAGICVLAVVVVLRLWRGLKKFNDYAPWFAAALAGSFIMFYWVYERTEPKFLTPVVDRLVYFLPSKAHQEQQIEKVRRAREELKR